MIKLIETSLQTTIINVCYGWKEKHKQTDKWINKLCKSTSYIWNEFNGVLGNSDDDSNEQSSSAHVSSEESIY